MARCTICNKATVFGNSRSHAMNQANRPFKPNLKKVKIVVNGTVKRVNVCTRCLRSNKVTRAI